MMRIATSVTGAVAALLLAAAGCDRDGAPMTDEDGGFTSLYNNVNGYCSAAPASCDDLVQQGDSAPTACCFGNQIFSCVGGSLKYKDCPGGCYTSSDGTTHCYAASGGGEESGEWQDPPTDPGPGF
jgi:hypothetical protein